jgi:predicted dehydrogenase
VTHHKVGIVGVGGIAGTHHQELSRLRSVTITGITDVDPARLKERSREWNVRAYPTFAALLEADIDAVFICTPPLTHRALAERAAQASKHIYLEKPVALSLADADAIIAAVEQAGVTLMVGFNLRYEPLRRAILERVQAGDVGDLVLVWEEHWIYRSTPDWKQFLETGPWRKSYEESGGRMSEFGSHIVNWQQAIAGPAKAVTGFASTITAPGVVDDFNLAQFTFAQGAGLISLAISATTPPRWSFGVVGTEGTLISDGQQLCLQPRDRGLTSLVPAPACESRWEHFFRCLETGQRPLSDGRDARATLAAVLAFYESVHTGKTAAVSAQA